ncbi:MAG: permease [Candidatus Omnitrophica bacterium 4484_171]|nr:MAG: permease [Candidatus Omnitrophica bacterium 4484_171]
MQIIYLLLLGVVAGVLSGFLGIGGGVVIIPALIYIFDLTQHQAQGTTLALMVPPIGLLAAMSYYRAGNVKISMAAFICAGFFIGALIGAEYANKIPDMVLRKTFGVFILFIAVKLIIGK